MKADSQPADAFGMRRLPFKIPSFVRCAWVSDIVRATWEPRLRQIAAAQLQLRLLYAANNQAAAGKSVVEARVLQDLEKRQVDRGIQFEIVQKVGASQFHTSLQKPVPGQRFQYFITFGAGDSARQLRDAIRSSNWQEEARLSGVPECCALFHREVWAVHRFQDFTWPMACNSGRPSPVNCIELESHRVNMFWKWLGIPAVYFNPCSLNCALAGERCDAFQRQAINGGFAEIIAWMKEIFSWPIQWTARHGIAEILSPIVKVIVPTDATATTFTIRLHSDVRPANTPRGLGFPYISQAGNYTTLSEN